MLLPAQYNFMILEEYRRGDFSPEFWAEIEPYITAREKPAIIHLILKPDLFLYKETPLFHDLYWGYIKHTPYKKYARKTSYWSWANISKWMRRLGSKEGRRKLKTTLRGVILNKSK